MRKGAAHKSAFRILNAAWILCAILVALALAACDTGSSGETPAVPSTPTTPDTGGESLKSVAISGSTEIAADGTAKLTAEPHDENGKKLDGVAITYTWEITSGGDYAMLTDADKQTATLTGKNAKDGGKVTVTVTATLGKQTATDDYEVTVAAQGVAVKNEITSVSITADPATAVEPGKTVTLTANVTKTGNPTVTYTWSLDAETYGTLSATTGETVTLTAKNTSTSSQTVAVKVTASDGTNSKDSTATVTVNAVKPTLNSVTISGGSAEIAATGTTELTATPSGDNLDGAEITYAWSLDEGNDAHAELSAASGETVTLTGKNDNGTEQSVTVTVKATLGEKEVSNTHTVTVKGATGEDKITSVSITADPDAAVESGKTVTLTAKAEYTGNPTVTYKWEITSGSEYGTLTDVDKQTAKLMGKNTTNTAQKITVKVTATCGERTVADDYEVTVAAQGTTVKDEITGVSITADPATAVESGKTVTLTANVTKTGNPTVTYKWEITSGSEYGTLTAADKQTATLTAKNTSTSSQTVAVKVTASDGTNSKDSTATVTVNVATYKVSVAGGIQNGSVTAEPTSATQGAKVTLTASPNSGYKLGGFTVTYGSNQTVSTTAVAGDANKATFTMPAGDVTVSATFTQIQYKVSVAGGIQNGGVTAEPMSAAQGATVTLTATPSNGYKLGGFTVKQGNTTVSTTAVAGDANKATFTMPTGDVTVSATFTQIQYKVSVAGGIQNGSVTANPTSAAQGATVTLTAAPSSGYTLGGFTVIYGSNQTVNTTAVAGDANKATFTMPAGDVTVSATFTQMRYNVSVASGIQNGSVTANPTSAAQGATVTLTAVPNGGYTLDKFTVTDGSGQTINTTADASDANKATFTMPAGDVTVNVTFKIRYNVTVDSNIANGGVTAEPTSAAQGATVTLTATPKSGYKLGSFTVKQGDTTVSTTADASNANKATFTMPAGDVTVSATFAEVKAEVSANFVAIKGATVREDIGYNDDPFYNATTTPVEVKSFYIAETELTYAQWKEVYDWATSDARGDKKYTFANVGQKGGASWYNEAEHTDDEPVTRVSWRDAIVWCNAASERAGFAPVYLTSGTDRTPVRLAEQRDLDSGWIGTNTSNTTVANAGDGKAEKAYVDTAANGYRLPTEAEWEFAARGGDPTARAWKYKYAGTNSETYLKDYAVYGDYYSTPNVLTTAAVKSKRPNTAGLYDMSGNVGEWCWDRISQNCRRRGGGWNSANEGFCEVAYNISYGDIRSGNSWTGIRLVRNAQ